MIRVEIRVEIRIERSRVSRRQLGTLSRAIGAFAVFVMFGLGAACRPTLDDRPWLIRQPQIVGWIAEPPEVSPGATVSLRIVALGPAGTPDTTATAWTLCHAPRPLDENRVVAADCLATHLNADTIGDPIAIPIPIDACRVFGPDTPQPLPGAPPTRPHDPDASGGYYQPITIALGAALAVGLERVTCDLPDASLAAARAFQAGYHPNQNPVLDGAAAGAGLTLTRNGAPVDASAIPGGARIHVEATWPAGTRERFPVFDRSAGVVVERQEELTASWYVTGGELMQPALRIADPATQVAATDWTAPETPATVTIALVLTDSRGGSAAVQAVVGITPSP